MSTSTQQQKQLSPVAQIVRTIVLALVDFPEQVVVSEVEGTQITVIEVQLLEQSDVGKVIGRHGATANNIRGLLVPMSHGQRRFILEILEPDGSSDRQWGNSRPDHVSRSRDRSTSLFNT